MWPGRSAGSAATWTGPRSPSRRAHELGRDPQPGLALLRLGQGRAAVAGAAFRVALSAEGIGPVGRARLLSAEVEVALALGELDRAGVARAELDVIVAGSGAALLNAVAAVARAAVQLAAGDPLAALPELRRAGTLWLHLGLPYPTVQTRGC